jgi:hypothetical protein
MIDSVNPELETTEKLTLEKVNKGDGCFFMSFDDWR